VTAAVSALLVVMMTFASYNKRSIIIGLGGLVMVFAVMIVISAAGGNNLFADNEDNPFLRIADNEDNPFLRFFLLILTAVVIFAASRFRIGTVLLIPAGVITLCMIEFMYETRHIVCLLIFMIAGVMTIAAGSLLAGKLLVPKKESWRKVAVLSLVQTVLQYYFFFMALANTSGVRGSIIVAAGNFFTILFAAYIFRFEKMTLRKMLGCLVGFAGILTILGGGKALAEGGQMTLAGEGAMLASDFFYAASGCLIKVFSRDENPVTLSGYQFFTGGMILAVIGLFMGGRLDFRGMNCVLNLLYLGFISAGAYTMWGVLLKYNPVSRVSILGFVNPVMGVLLSALFLGEGREAFSLTAILALLLVSAGIVIVNTAEKK
jgi:drug/metabolite transporter (DMT)-like permease